jgi:hypothetical protein
LQPTSRLKRLAPDKPLQGRRLQPTSRLKRLAPDKPLQGRRLQPTSRLKRLAPDKPLQGWRLQPASRLKRLAPDKPLQDELNKTLDEDRGRLGDESQSVGQEDLRELQDRAACRRGTRHLQQNPQAQAASGLEPSQKVADR